MKIQRIHRVEFGSGTRHVVEHEGRWRVVEGDIFGEIGIVENRPQPASFQASEPTVVARLSPEILQTMLDQSKAAASGMKLLIARRLMQTLDKLRE